MRRNYNKQGRHSTRKRQKPRDDKTIVTERYMRGTCNMRRKKTHRKIRAYHQVILVSIFRHMSRCVFNISSGFGRSRRASVIWEGEREREKESERGVAGCPAIMRVHIRTDGRGVGRFTSDALLKIPSRWHLVARLHIEDPIRD